MSAQRFASPALLGLLLAVGGALQACAQSADALINKLVDKGILTTKEANDLREETDKNYDEALSHKTGITDWMKTLQSDRRCPGAIRAAGVRRHVRRPDGEGRTTSSRTAIASVTGCGWGWSRR